MYSMVILVYIHSLCGHYMEHSVSRMIVLAMCSASSFDVLRQAYPWSGKVGDDGNGTPVFHVDRGTLSRVRRRAADIFYVIVLISS